jgi:hypothetical protein
VIFRCSPSWYGDNDHPSPFPTFCLHRCTGRCCCWWWGSGGGSVGNATDRCVRTPFCYFVTSKFWMSHSCSRLCYQILHLVSCIIIFPINVVLLVFYFWKNSIFLPINSTVSYFLALLWIFNFLFFFLQIGFLVVLGTWRRKI